MGLGRVVKGTVNCCNPKFLERRLKNYDKQLYIKWNADKNYGYGLWEVRRLPESKINVFKGFYLDGSPIFSLEYVENDLTHHVMDINTLTERVLDKLYAMDTYRVHNWADKLDYEQERSQISIENKQREELAYQLRSEKKALEELYEAARSGINPAHFFAGKYK